MITYNNAHKLLKLHETSYFCCDMKWLKEKYRENINGIIVTLLFHIIVFSILNITQFNKKETHESSEIIFDFPEEIIQEEPQPPEQDNNSNVQADNSNLKTNAASNKASSTINETFDEEYYKELEQAKDLVKDVSNQLSKDIPTIKDLKMPEETTEGLNPDSLMKKLYTGESNVEYFLENRYHTRLPIPVYLSQYGGKVRVNIVVNSLGRTISAEPVNTGNLPEQLLSYAKTAALRTRFNSDKTIRNQKGYITYNFIAQ